MQKPMFKQLHLPEYGNIALATRASPQMDSVSGYPHGSKFQPSKSTDRLLASMEAPGREDSIGDNEEDSRKEWETSFIEKQPIHKLNNGPDAAQSLGPTVSIFSIFII